MTHQFLQQLPSPLSLPLNRPVSGPSLAWGATGWDALSVITCAPASGGVPGSGCSPLGKTVAAIADCRCLRGADPGRKRLAAVPCAVIAHEARASNFPDQSATFSRCPLCRKGARGGPGIAVSVQQAEAIPPSGDGKLRNDLTSRCSISPTLGSDDQRSRGQGSPPQRRSQLGLNGPFLN